MNNLGHRRLEMRHAQLKRSLLQIGYILPGSVIKRFMPCGKPACRCSTGQQNHHGPYYQWSVALRGKPTAVRLTKEEAQLYRSWTRNNRKVKEILTEMRWISMRLAKHHMMALPRR